MVTAEQIALAVEDLGEPTDPVVTLTKQLAREMYGRNAWLMRPMLAKLEEAELKSYARDLANIWSLMLKASTDPVNERLSLAMKGLRFHSMEFLKLQLQFAKTGNYKSSDYDQVYQDVYGSDTVMAEYLDGLLLTYVAWPNHYRMLKWYRDAFLGQGPYGSCLEVGPGHGLLALEQLQAHPENTLLGLDISPHSVAYARGILAAGGVDPTRWDVREADARQALNELNGSFDRVVIAEVIEHVDDPESLIRAAVSRSHSSSLFFITTVVNIEAVDHIYLFRELDEVTAMMRKVGLSVQDELVMELEMNLPMERPAYEVALVCRQS